MFPHILWITPLREHQNAPVVQSNILIEQSNTLIEQSNTPIEQSNTQRIGLWVPALTLVRHGTASCSVLVLPPVGFACTD